MSNLNREAVEWAVQLLPGFFEDYDAIHQGIRQLMTVSDPEAAHDQAYQLATERRSISVLFLFVSLSPLKRHVFRARLNLNDDEYRKLAKLAFYFHYEPLFKACQKVAPSLEKPLNFHDSECFVHEQIDITGLDPERDLGSKRPWLRNGVVISGLRELPQWRRLFQLMQQAQADPLATYDQFDWAAFLEQVMPQLKRMVPEWRHHQADRGLAQVQAEDENFEQSQARRVLLHHAELMRRLYQDMPVFGQEAFSLAQIYIRTECGMMTWGEIKGSNAKKGRHSKHEEDDWQRQERRSLDPFMERNGGRHDIEATVLDLLGNAEYKDAIVVQGVAGSGKSSLTLRLCDTLLAEGFVPIRIRLRDVRFDPGLALLDALNQALQLEHPQLAMEGETPRAKRLLDESSLWQEAITYQGREISRYVLILDGWDEISVSADETFHQRAEQLLRAVRQTFIGRSLPIGLIVTGRPSAAVSETGFLLNETRVLTLRPLKPSDVEQMAELIMQAQQEQRFEVESAFVWQLEKDKVSQLVKAYDAALEEKRATALDVLGSPLLALLTMRVACEYKGDVETLVGNPTLLYRELIRQTCAKGGQPQQSAYPEKQETRIQGEELHQLLHATAVAMFINGQDNLSYAELDFRLGQLRPSWDAYVEALEELIQVNEANHPLMKLMISYFFKGGNRNLGCEFMHKSFREYLFAEAVVECLRAYGEAHTKNPPDRTQPFWENGKADDPRMQLAEDLAHMLAANWLTREIHDYLFSLLELVMQEELKAEKSKEAALQKWAVIRDGLADVYAWWADEIPMTSQAVRDRKSRSWQYQEPFFSELARWFLPYDRDKKKHAPISQTQLDGHLGDALWQLTAVVHYQVAVCSGWDDLGAEERWQDMQAHATCGYQVRVQDWVLFAPGGLVCDFTWLIESYNDTPFRLSARINAATARPLEPFPARAIMPGIACPKVWWWGVYAPLVKMSAANFYQASLDHARLVNARLDHASLVNASLVNARLDHASLMNASLMNARLWGTNIDKARVSQAQLDKADCRDLYGTPIEPD